MWVLRFDNGVASAGISVESWLAEELNLSENEPAWGRFLAKFPTIGKQFEAAKPVQPFVYAPKLSYRTSQTVGEGWAMLPSAAAFVDPLFSTGFPLTLLGVERLGKIISESWGKSDFNDRLKTYEAITFEEADWTAKFIGSCFASFRHFPLFSSNSMFYFAAASFSEMSRRLEKRYLVGRYLSADRKDFVAGVSKGSQMLRDRNLEVETYSEFVQTSISGMNVAGLCDASKRNWYGVNLQDVIDSSSLFEIDCTELSEIIKKAPWAQG